MAGFRDSLIIDAASLADDDIFLIDQDGTELTARVTSSQIKTYVNSQLNQELNTSGAIPLTKNNIILNVVSGGALNLTLANGSANQLLTIVSKSATSNIIVTPTNFVKTNITFTLAGQSIVLKFISDKWYIISNYETTVA
jgi:hypothetical protein